MFLLSQGIDDLGHQSADHRPTAVGQIGPCGDHRQGAHASQAPGSFDQQNLDAQPCRTYRGRGTGRATASHDEIVACFHGDLTAKRIGSHA